MKKLFINSIGEDWINLLGFDYIIKTLVPIGIKINLDRKKYKIYPKNGVETFKIFKSLSPDKIKVIIVGQDPYHDGSYDGRAFSNSTDTQRISPSLRNILKEIESDIYNGLQLYKDPCLKRLEKQGVLLMNRVLTVRAGSPGSHANIGWESFTGKVLRKLSDEYEDLVYMLWGANAAKAVPYIDSTKHLILTSGHPSPLSANQGYWFGNKHFSQANTHLKIHKKSKIIW